ncbi:DUF1294 domain-containing protein [Pseudomonas sp. gcc21]|uniref:DUF1294 domain-containing protein n=1 Tax=Pseudomonas sp. gcc21 TaxID=2726989 RepID=UPI00145145F4|nr:DUF1294 domain-containing protein [Pseudomonas sp. gcc21]QJD60895.1 DUF1294 domain-containing protein [Pseudomonas sp. gcc21]
MQHRLLKTVVFGVLCALPLTGALHLASGGVFWPLVVYAAASLISYLMYRSDKRSAIASRQRIPEKWLHLSEGVGGWPGALMAQQLLRHKTRKLSYQLMFWLIVLLHQLFWFDWLVLDGRALGEWLRPLFN